MSEVHRYLAAAMGKMADLDLPAWQGNESRQIARLLLEAQQRVQSLIEINTRLACAGEHGEIDRAGAFHN